MEIATPAWSQSAAQIKDVAVPEIRSIEAEKAGRTPAQKKVSSQLLDALKQQINGSVVAAAPNLKADKLRSSNKGTLVDIDAIVNTPLLNSIKKAGGTIVNYHEEDHAIRAYIPLNKIESIAAQPQINSIAPAAKATTNKVELDREGRKAHAADEATTAFGVTGSGVKVGILSDSIDNGANALKSAFASGAMSKALLKVLPGQEGEGEGEGLAMAEIVHAIAPGASLLFATGNGGPAQMAANIRAMQKAGCKIIVDDLTYFNEPPFQDGPIARAVNDVSAAGVLYFSSARNSGSKKHGTSGTWEGDFRDGGAAPGELLEDSPHRVHLFDENMTINKVISAGPRDRVDLFWADPLGKSSNDYSLYVVDSDGHVLRSSTTSHTGTQDPYQSVAQLNQGESILITKSASAAPRFMHLDIGRARLKIGTEGNVRGHNASGATNAFSVAAIEAPNPPSRFVAGAAISVEEFSSDGPRRIFYRADGTPHTPDDFSSKGGVVLSKPDITAADGISTTLPSDSGLNPFFGTSAAAPHAAAIAALLASFDPTLSPAELREVLVGSALAIDGTGQNINAGAGIVMAFTALRIACLKKKPTCPTPTPEAEIATSNASPPSPRLPRIVR
jgi:subtilisin family serine protease